MTRRPGLTLTEVLVTLGILAFGILAILTLFPLAASQMAVAVREDRSAQAANAADGYMRAYWKKEIAERVINSVPVTEPFYRAMEDPNYLVTPPRGLTAAPVGEASYPCFVDPIGFNARPLATRDWSGDSGSCNSPRRSLSLLGGNVTHGFRVCSLMDGMGYDDNGRPTPDRELRYNWAWVVQREASDTAAEASNFSVVVYDNRPNLYAPTGTEASFTATVTPGTTRLVAGGPVNAKPGSWIMDVTDPTLNPTPPNKIRHGYAYQIVSIVEGGAPTIELQTPLKKANDPSWTAGAYLAKFVVLRGVTNVYPRSKLSGN